MADFPLLMEVEQLARSLPTLSNCIILEQAKLDNYQQGHIINSYWLDFKRLQASQGPAGMLPEASALKALFSEYGITPDTHIICSDDEGGGWAGRLIWILDCIGHKHYSFLNGGLTAWRAAGLECTTAIPAKTPSHYSLQIDQAPFTVTQEQILASLEDHSLTLWDSRSAAEYSGEKALTARGGHIPTAIHYEWTQALDKANGLRLRPLDELITEIQSYGFTPEQSIAAYCQTHHRSGFVYFLGKLLSFNIKGYAGSWSQWGNDPDTPISVGTHP